MFALEVLARATHYLRGFIYKYCDINNGICHENALSNNTNARQCRPYMNFISNQTYVCVSAVACGIVYKITINVLKREEMNERKETIIET